MEGNTLFAVFWVCAALVLITLILGITTYHVWRENAFVKAGYTQKYFPGIGTEWVLPEKGETRGQ